MAGSFWKYFLFYGLVEFFLHLAWLEGTSSSYPRFYFASSPGILAAVFTHLVTPTAVLKTDFLILISVNKKGCYFRFRILANHLASFFCQAIRLDNYLFHPVTECKHLLAFILTWIYYFGREELTYIPYSSFNGMPLAAC